MKKTIFSIIVLLCLISGVGYYGYITLIAPAGLSEQEVDNELSDFDKSTQDISEQGITEETTADISGESMTITQVVPATTADIDGLVADINSFSTSDTSAFNASLNDL